MPTRRFTDEQEREIAAHYPEKSTHQLAKIHNASIATINSAIRRQGGKLIKRGGSPPRKFTDEQEREIASQYPAKSTYQLAELYNTSEATVNSAIKRQGGKLRGKGEINRKFTDEQEAEIAAQYPAKDTVELAKIYNASANTIKSAIERQGVKLRIKSEINRRFTDEQEQVICQRYEEGESTCELAEALDAYGSIIGKVLSRNGVERREAGGYGDSVQHVLDGTGYHQHQRECEVYLFGLARYSATHCKTGIAFDTDTRADEEYGEEVLRMFFASRSEAYFLEQAVLDATRGSAGYPADLIDWAGHTEVRMMPAADMVQTILRLAEELEELGQWEFAARYVPMTAAQRAICQQRALVEVAK